MSKKKAIVAIARKRVELMYTLMKKIKVFMSLENLYSIL